MKTNIYHYPLTIQETHLDVFGHVNNAVYLTLLEQARWEIINNNGYDLNKIKETGLGPTIIEIKINFHKELCLHEKIIIETQILSYERKIGRIGHRILRGEELCCTAEFVIGLFDIKQRKLVAPTQDWLKALGLS
jgi:thioesterase-3